MLSPISISSTLSVEASLKKLRTDYIDLFYIHYYDMTTSAEELMQSLNTLVTARKVLYLGISDTPAWFVVKCNSYARHHGLRPFSVYQGKHSATERDLEREIIPMSLDQGVSLAPWGALDGGYSNLLPGSAPMGDETRGIGEDCGEEGDGYYGCSVGVCGKEESVYTI
ncbi:MAG: hypothetical protein Q9221_005589 [Calogaya cf. arnoldii]